jgi:hypothetical protein
MPMLTRSSIFLSRVTVPVIGLLALAIFTFLYISYPAADLFITKAMIQVPAPGIFADWDWVPASIRCWSEGVNVYVINPCYKIWPDVAVFNYSPLLLRAKFLQSLEGWTGVIGLSIAALFFISLASLPRPRTLRDQVIVVLAMLSCGSFLAVDRGNLDLIMFLAVIAALNLRALSLPFRLAGYALITLAGLLKFYPFVALIVVLRERTAVLSAVAVASSAALMALLLTYHEELVWMVRNLPAPSYYTLQFSAADLPKGLGVAIAKMLVKTVHEDRGAARELAEIISRCLLPVLMAGAATAALVLSRRYRLPAALTRLSPRETDFLIVGAAVICGCFLACPNVIYRGIFFLLALPGLATISHNLPARRGRGALGGTCAAIVFVLWKPLLDSFLFLAGWTERLDYQVNVFDGLPGVLPGFLSWLLGELAWWWIVTVLLAILGAFVVGTELWSILCVKLRLPASWQADTDLTIVRHGSAWQSPTRGVWE